MFCKYCGAKIDDDSAFCPRCGKTLKGGRRTAADDQRGSSAPKGGSSVKKVIYGIIALLCVVPVPIAEYRRIVHGEFGVQYWLLCAPILFSCYFLYKVLVGNQIEEEKEKIRLAKEQGRDYEDNLLKIRTNAISVFCLVVAVVGFGSGILVNLLF